MKTTNVTNRGKNFVNKNENKRRVRSSIEAALTVRLEGGVDRRHGEGGWTLEPRRTDRLEPVIGRRRAFRRTVRFR